MRPVGRSKGSPLRRAALAGAVLASIAATAPRPAEGVVESASTLWVDAASPARLPRGTRAEPYPTIGEALAAARPGSVIRVAPGEYWENVTIPHGIALVGEGPSRPILHGASPFWPFWRKPVVTMHGESSLEFVRVTGGEEGVHVDVNARIRLARVEIVDNHRNGIGFERVEKVGGEPATVDIEDCLITGNSDGIDLESTRGEIRKSRLIGNRDDGVDYDGNTDCAVVDNEIRDNGDDGIEIRLKQDTLARIERNRIRGNGEDGVEIINTWQPEPTANRVEIADNEIHGNSRYGIGAVDQVSEEVQPGLRIAGIVLGQNRLSGNGKADVAGVSAPSGPAPRRPARAGSVR